MQIALTLQYVLLIIQAGPSELWRGRDDCVPLVYEPCAPGRRRQLQRTRQDGPGLQRQPLPAGERSVRFILHNFLFPVVP